MAEPFLNVCVMLDPDDQGVLERLERIERLKRADILRRALRAYLRLLEAQDSQPRVAGE